RGYLRTDGISCYFDPNLEAEALGARLEWQNDVAHIVWPDASRNGGHPVLRPAEVAAKSARVAVAIDVIKRLNALVRDGTLLMAGVTGPHTLAAKIMQRGDAEPADIPAEVLEHAASVTTAMSAAFAEAGANVIFIREELLPALSPEQFETRTSLLTPTFNVIRFYQALPVLHFATDAAVNHNRDLIFEHQWECVISVPIRVTDMSDINALGLGLALPAGEEIDDRGATSVAERHPVLITTTDDVSPSTDLKRLTKVFGEVQR
ncbi:MAG: hypothetical protein JOY79_02880, partial [Acidobacteriaceae bacterium]|nr:hypothetical protein [Acidobacteriaceae bacterium]